MNHMSRNVFSKTGISFCRLASVRLLSQKGGNLKFDEMVKNKPIVVFMKGTPEAPKCGFSNAVCQILRFHGIDNFTSYDVLSDDDIRSGIKEYTNWPTVPQVFFNGDFIGGCDILLDMHKNGDLIEELKKLGIRSVLLDSAAENEENKKS